MADKTITFTLNGKQKTFSIKPSQTLLDLLRNNGYTGTKFGCGDGACGSCSVMLDGRSVNACITYAFQVHGRQVVTIEGIGDYDKPDPFQKHMVECAGVQCGFCIPGIVVSARALLNEIPNPTREEVEEYLDGNYCRCTGYEKIEDALHKTIAESVKGEPKWTR